MFSHRLMLALAAANGLFAQALTPPAIFGQPENASALLARAREKVLNSIRRLPKYTCLETIDRAYYIVPPQKHGPHMMTEQDAAAAACVVDRSRLLLVAKDRLRVEVTAAGGVEIHSWPGASRFDVHSFDELIPFGPLSTGSFGTSLFDVFANPGTQIRFNAKKLVGARDTFEYSFRVPLKASHTGVKGGREWKMTAVSGSFDIDATTAELISLTFETDPLPSNTEMCRAKVSTGLHFVLIGDGEFLLPHRSELETYDTDGGQTDSVTRFSACREYTAESSIRFDDHDQHAPASVESTRLNAPALPPGVSLTLALTNEIDLSTAAAGDRLSARLVHAGNARGSKQVLAPAGSIARGRILAMRYELRTSEFQISIRFDTLETKGAIAPLSVRLTREIKAEQRDRLGFVNRGTEFLLPAPGSMRPEGHFVFPAKSGVRVVHAGFQSKWTTVA